MKFKTKKYKIKIKDYSGKLHFFFETTQDKKGMTTFAGLLHYATGAAMLDNINLAMK
jgi:hypothetical protein